MDKLKHCPFCGVDEPTITVRIGKNGFRDRYAVLCDYNDGGCGSEGGWYHSREEAVAAWNARAENAWVSVKDRLPAIGEKVLVYSKFSHVSDMTLQRHGGQNGYDVLIFYPHGMKPGTDITHWMALPEPPEVSE